MVAQSASSAPDQPWIYAGNLMGGTLMVQGLGPGDSVSLRVKNQDPLLDGSPGSDQAGNFPDPSDDGVPHATAGNITADTALFVGVFTYIKLLKTAGGSPSATTANYVGQIPK